MDLRPSGSSWYSISGNGETVRDVGVRAGGSKLVQHDGLLVDAPVLRRGERIVAFTRLVE
jgi:hypothetical protein